MDMLEEIIAGYLQSGDFNGISIKNFFDGSGQDTQSVKNQLATLTRDGKISINFGDRHPNAHIKAFPPEPAEEQVAKLQALEIEPDIEPEPDDIIWYTDTGGVGHKFNVGEEPNSALHHVCVYPEPAALAGCVGRSGFEGRPFVLRLALGEPQLGFETFDLNVLEHYRNDPRFYYTCNDVGGFISVHDKYAISDDFPESEMVLLQTFGFCYDKSFNRAVAVFNRYLADLTPEHQRIWQAKIVAGEYFLHPDYERSSNGHFPEKLSIFDAFLMELKCINDMCELMSKPKLFREAPSLSSRPRHFGFLLRPTVKEFQEFVSLLDKLMSDNLNKAFFEDDLELTEEIQRNDGKIEVRQKGTIRLLGEWFKTTVKLQEPEVVDTMSKIFKDVRNLRQRPAHALDDNKFDQSIFKQQRELVMDAYGAIRMIRLILANHPATIGYEVNDMLYRAKIWNL